MAFTHPDYTIIKTLGQGASGSVYLAVQNRLNRKVAVKVVIDSSTDAGGQRFLREAHILAQLDHPNIVSVYELTELHDQPGYLLAMAYVEGGNLRERTEQLTLRDALTTVTHIAKALGYAHQHGFIHRDVKPENILFQGDQAMLADFGIARLTDSQTRMTQHGAMLGTPTYMSPEQVNGATVDARCDLYSLGIVLYELLAGTPPYKAETAIATGIQHLTRETPLLPAVYACYQPFIERVLAKDKAERPADAEMFIRELDRATSLLQWPLDEPLQWLRLQADTSRTPDVGQPRKKNFMAIRAAGVLIIALGVTWLLFSRIQLPDDIEESQASGETPANVTASDSTSGSPSSDHSADQGTAVLTVEDISIDDPSPAESINETSIPSASDELASQLADADAKKKSGNWFDVTPNAVTIYRSVLAIDPQQPAALEALQEITDKTRVSIEQLIRDKNWDQASSKLATLQTNWPDFPQLAELALQNEQSRERDRALQQRLARERAAQRERTQRIQSLINNATVAETAGRLWQPLNNNALFYYRAALSEDPDNETSRNAIDRLKKTWVQNINMLINDENLLQAKTQVSAFNTAFPDDVEAISLTAALAKQSERLAQIARQRQQEDAARQQAVEINALEVDVNEWLNTSSEQSMEIYPVLAQRINTLLQKSPLNEKLIQLQSDAKQRFSSLSAAAEEDADDIFRMPGF